MTLRTVQGDEAKALIQAQIAAHDSGISQVLARYDASSAADTWHSAIRGIEEFINLPLFGLQDEALERWLLALPLGQGLEEHPGLALEAKARLTPLFGPEAARRFFHVMG